jgi:glycosyltransferase involved in cell wall biosynthesis
MPLVQIFIATYNRPILVEKAIRSALAQDFDSFEVIVSDNSTTDETESMISMVYAHKLKYKRRKPSLLPIEHLNAILDDVTSQFFMIFHDDDLMYSNMVKELYHAIVSNKSLISVGANARIITPVIIPNRLMLKRKYGNQIISDRDRMAHQYLVKRGIVPLSSYLHREEVSKRLRFNQQNGGKHCDVAFIMDLASIGNVMMLQKPLMDYIVSSGQDSQTNNFLHRIKLINYITKTTSFTKNSSLIKRFRVVNLYYEIVQDWKQGHNISSKRRIQIIKLIFRVSPFDFFPRILYKLAKS